MEKERLLKEFCEDYRLTGHTTSAIILRSRVRKLFGYLEERGLQVAEVGYKEALGYQLWLRETQSTRAKAYNSGTLAGFMNKALAFYEFLKKRRLVAANPFLELDRVKTEKSIPRGVLKEAEVDRLLEELACFNSKKRALKSLINYYRAHLLCELMYASGLRISELANVKVEEINFEQGLIEVARGKGGKRRTVIVNAYALSLLKLYVEEILPLMRRGYHTAGLLFGAGGNRLLISTNAILKEAAAKLKLPPITCHGFRHALGTHLLRRGCDLRYIQVILGHRNIQNTEIYTRVEKEDLKAVVDRCHPRQLGGGQV
jgi:site-specific recombinase XerD